MTNLPWPHCDRCQKPVERLTTHYDGMAYIVEANCHGQREVTRLSFYDLADMGAEGLQAGVAFRQTMALASEAA